MKIKFFWNIPLFVEDDQTFTWVFQVIDWRCVYVDDDEKQRAWNEANVSLLKGEEKNVMSEMKEMRREMK